MSKKGARQTFFVCASLTASGELITQTIPATSPDEASRLFSKEHTITPQEVLGPFYKKRVQVLENTRELKFSNQTKKAVYNDWLVDAFLLKEPENQAYLIFTRRLDGKKMPAPKGTVVVPISDLRFTC